MEDMLQGLDRTTALGIAGTVVLLTFGTFYYFGSTKSPKTIKKKAAVIKSDGKSVSSTSSGTVRSTTTTSTTGSSTVKSSTSSTSTSTMSSTPSEMRGYKMTSDGRKTTYFNREISEEEKILLGDSTPKPLTSTTSVDNITQQSSSIKSTSSSGSAWNAAGTWEEKNHSPWAVKQLKQLLNKASLDILVNNSSVGTVRLCTVYCARYRMIFMMPTLCSIVLTSALPRPSLVHSKLLCSTLLCLDLLCSTLFCYAGLHSVVFLSYCSVVLYFIQLHFDQ